MQSIAGRPWYLPSKFVPAMKKIDPYRAVPGLEDNISIEKNAGMMGNQRIQL
ncbi:MAG TPA: hypothetical protein VKM55_03005 [Candidatus Lokiarchaeia archaeon]|nr:hypothetical protein [Candidatus Lokiarchaeia archaeon]